MDSVKYGTELKISVSIGKLDGYHMSDIDFSCRFFTYSNRFVDIVKSEMVKIDDDSYIALVDSRNLASGEIRLNVTAHIPDEDFPDGLRTEIVGCSTGITILS